MVRVHPDRVLDHRAGHAVGRGFRRLDAVAAADAAAEDMEPRRADMIHQRHVVGRIGVPAMIGLDRAAGGAGVALVHGDDVVAFLGQNLGPVAPTALRAVLGVVPHREVRPQAAGGEQQDGEAGFRAVFLVIDFAIRAREHGHGGSSVACWGAPYRRWWSGQGRRPIGHREGGEAQCPTNPAASTGTASRFRRSTVMRSSVRRAQAPGATCLSSVSAPASASITIRRALVSVPDMGIGNTILQHLVV